MDISIIVLDKRKCQGQEGRSGRTHGKIHPPHLASTASLHGRNAKWAENNRNGRFSNTGSKDEAGLRRAGVDSSGLIQCENNRLDWGRRRTSEWRRDEMMELKLRFPHRLFGRGRRAVVRECRAKGRSRGKSTRLLTALGTTALALWSERTDRHPGRDAAFMHLAIIGDI